MGQQLVFKLLKPIFLQLSKRIHSFVREKTRKSKTEIKALTTDANITEIIASS